MIIGVRKLRRDLKLQKCQMRILAKPLICFKSNRYVVELKLDCIRRNGGRELFLYVRDWARCGPCMIAFYLHRMVRESFRGENTER